MCAGVDDVLLVLLVGGAVGVVFGVLTWFAKP
jgi:hypothetical protein